MFLYYNLTEAALLIGPLHSQGLLRVQPTGAIVMEKFSEVDYSLPYRYFAFSSWKQWDPRRRQFFPNRNLSHMRPECVDESFGFCSSGYLYPVDVSVSRVGGTQLDEHEYVDLRQVYFRLVDSVLHNLRPVYEMVSENETSEHPQRYLYHENGKWRVGAKIGSESVMTGIILELESSAMRVEYENKTEWHSLHFSLFTPEHTRRRAFGRLECRRQLPDGIDCQTAGIGACDNGGTCHTDASGVSSCQCAAGYRGIRCEHRIPRCATSFHTPPRASSVFGGSAPHYEGSIMTIFCLLGDVSFSVCQNGSWQSTSKRECSIPSTSTSTATTLATTTRTWISHDNSSYVEHVSEDSAETIAVVIIMLVCVQLGCPFLCYCCVAFCRSDEEQELPADDEPSDLKTEPKKHRTSLQRTCSGFFYVCWWVWLAFVIVYFVQYGYIPLDGSSVFSATVIMAFVCLGVLYCCVFSESFCSREYNYLSELENEEVTTGEQIAEMKAAKPAMTFKVECSHDETKTHTVQKILTL